MVLATCDSHGGVDSNESVHCNLMSITSEVAAVRKLSRTCQPSESVVVVVVRPERGRMQANNGKRHDAVAILSGIPHETKIVAEIGLERICEGVIHSGTIKKGKLRVCRASESSCRRQKRPFAYNDPRHAQVLSREYLMLVRTMQR